MNAIAFEVVVTRPMNRLIHHAQCSDSRFRPETLESQRGASHLNSFDTSPLQVHTHANFCMRM